MGYTLNCHLNLETDGPTRWRVFFPQRIPNYFIEVPTTGCNMFGVKVMLCPFHQLSSRHLIILLAIF